MKNTPLMSTYLFKLVFIIIFCISNAQAQEDEPIIYEMPYANVNNFYDIPLDKKIVQIPNMNPKEKILLHTLVDEDINSSAEATDYFFKKYKIKSSSPFIVNKEKNVKYDFDLTIEVVSLQKIIIKDYYMINNKNPTTYNLYLVGRNNQEYLIDMSWFEKKRQENFFTDFEGDYLLEFLPQVKNINISKNSTLYAYKDGINYYFKNEDTNLYHSKLILLSNSKKTKNENNIYIDFLSSKFSIEIKNLDLNKDTLYLFNANTKDINWSNDEQNLKIQSGLDKMIILSNYEQNDKKIKICEYSSCTTRFITLEELKTAK